MGKFVNIKKKKGLTLVEMIASVLILGLALGAMLGSFIIGRISASKAKHRIEVTNLLRQGMETLKNLPYESIDDQGPGPIFIDPTEGLMGTLTVDVTDQSGYKEVEVIISWDDLSWGGTSSVSESLMTIMGPRTREDGEVVYSPPEAT